MRHRYFIRFLATILLLSLPGFSCVAYRTGLIRDVPPPIPAGDGKPDLTFTLVSPEWGPNPGGQDPRFFTRFVDAYALALERTGAFRTITNVGIGASTRADHADLHLDLEYDTTLRYAWFTVPSAILTGITLSLVPGYGQTQFNVRATVLQKGKTVGRYEYKEAQTLFAWLLLAPFIASERTSYREILDVIMRSLARDMKKDGLIQ